LVILPVEDSKWSLRLQSAKKEIKEIINNKKFIG